MNTDKNTAFLSVFIRGQLLLGQRRDAGKLVACQELE